MAPPFESHASRFVQIALSLNDDGQMVRITLNRSETRETRNRGMLVELDALKNSSRGHVPART